MANVESTYIINASKFVLFKWMSLMDENKCDVNELLYLLCDTYTLNFRKDNPISNDKSLENWLNWSKGQILQSSHYITNLTTTKNSEHECIIDFQVNYLVKKNVDDVLTAKTHHTWLMILDNGDIPRIKRIDEEILEDFHETEEPFQSLSATNKVLSLVYRWFSLLDRSYYSKYVEDFIGLLSDDFEMSYPTATWHKRNEVRQWLLIGGKKQRNAHHITKIDILNIDNNKVDLTIELDWESITQEGEYKELKFGYDWKTIDYDGFLPCVEYFNGYLLE